MKRELTVRMNISNILSFFRVFLIPFFIILLFGQSLSSAISAFAIFFIAAITDYLDGLFARKYKLKTPFGEFFDPLADKLLVGSAFITFIFVSDLYVPAWLVLIILIREVFVTLMRLVAIKKNTPLRTEFLGKIKTAFQMFTIFVILGILLIKRGAISQQGVVRIGGGVEIWQIISNHRMEPQIFSIPMILVAVSAVLAFVSMLQYLLKNRNVFSKTA